MGEKNSRCGHACRHKRRSQAHQGDNELIFIRTAEFLFVFIRTAEFHISEFLKELMSTGKIEEGAGSRQMFDTSEPLKLSLIFN